MMRDPDVEIKAVLATTGGSHDKVQLKAPRPIFKGLKDSWERMKVKCKIHAEN